MTHTITAAAPARGRRHGRLLGALEAQRAFYVDYEGSKGRAPTLLGYLVGDELSAGIVEPLFAPCHAHYRAAHAERADHVSLLAALIDRAEREDRLIVSWSEHDLRVMREALAGDTELEAVLTRRHRDGRLTARRWRSITHAGVEGPNSLDLYRALLKLKLPERFGHGVVGRALGTLRAQLAGGRGYDTLSDGAREGWRVVVAHNKYDLLHTRQVCMVTAEALALRARDRQVVSTG